MLELFIVFRCKLHILYIPFITFTATVWGTPCLEFISNLALNTVPNSPKKSIASYSAQLVS